MEKERHLRAMCNDQDISRIRGASRLVPQVEDLHVGYGAFYSLPVKSITTLGQSRQRPISAPPPSALPLVDSFSQMKESRVKFPRKSASSYGFVVTMIFLFGLSLASARASDVYVAQNSAGAANGADCADAYSVSWLNSTNSWGTSTGQIGPGTTVHLCGTISGAITAHGNGTSAQPITILFDAASHGQISMPALPTSGALILDGTSYIVVDGGGTGIIQSTSNGSPSSLCSSSTYTNSVMSIAIHASNASNVTIKNLTIGPVYVHVCTADDSTNHPALSPPYPTAIYFLGASNFTIQNNTIHDGGWLLFGTGNYIYVENNNLYYMDHGFGGGTGSTNSTFHDLYFINNHLHDTNVWNTDDNSFHHDGIHLWGYCDSGSTVCTTGYIYNVYIYNNLFDGAFGSQNVTSWVFLEANIQDVYVFNNYFNGTNALGWGPALCEIQGVSVQSYNNTVVGYSTTSGNTNAAFYIGGPQTVSRNNLVSTSNSLIGTTLWTYLQGEGSYTYTLSNNVYANGGANSFVWCNPANPTSCSYYNQSQYSSWAAVSGETNGSYSTSALINSDGTLQAGSPAIGAGANLYSLCNGQPNPGVGALCYDKNGSPRPSSGPWDAGAFNSGVIPAAPTGLTGVVK